MNFFSHYTDEYTNIAARVGNMKQILCFDWLPERARWAYCARTGLPALILRKKTTELVLTL